MNKKLLLGALIGAGMSMLNKKIRQQSAPAPGKPPPDFTKVPAPDPGDGPSLDDILTRATKPGGLGSAPAAPGGGQSGPVGGDIFGGAIPTGAGAGGAAVLMEIARRIFAQMQQGGGQAAPQGGPGASGGDVLGDILGQIFGRAGGKFGQQGPSGPQAKPGDWQKMRPQGDGGLFGFVNSQDGAAGEGEQQADVMLKAMIAAAQADGQIDGDEQRNILQALDGRVDTSDLEGLKKLLTTPIHMEEVVGEASDPATAFNLYLVSSMTINPDNAREREYLDRLAQELGISEQAAQVIEQQIPRG